ncbi:MAG: hypothetical protein U9O94_11750 [Nanoarchaeota archaeon]|nr:hypothetical protein [Nanoarchaeota archaeon]
MPKKEENPLFVGIENNSELRRNLLECSKGILESLKSYESFKSAKKEKHRLIEKFKSNVRDISKLINKLKTAMPKVKEVGIKKPGKKVVKKEENPLPAKVEGPKEKTELEKLEAELNDIEGKLNTLA